VDGTRGHPEPDILHDPGFRDQEPEPEPEPVKPEPVKRAGKPAKSEEK
jgi:hypothetical protein